MGARRPLRGPDAVAYRLVISACARGGQWSDGIRLLQELRDNISPPDVVAYTAAITGCEKAGKWKEAFGLLDMMRKDGVCLTLQRYRIVSWGCREHTTSLM